MKMVYRFRAVLSVLLALCCDTGADVVTDWNSAALNAIRTERTNPPKASRALAIAHLSIYDAVNGLSKTHRPYHMSASAPPGTSMEAAAASAGFTALNALFTSAQVQTAFRTRYDTILAAIPESQAKADGVAWGQSMAQAILALRAGDGWNSSVTYNAADQPGRWKPTPPSFASALLPAWGSVTPFCMTSGAEFRPFAPPPLNTAAWAFEYNVIKALGGATSSARTANQTEVAYFWDDGAGSATPPGHWNVIAHEVSESKSLTMAENARLFALLNIALADAAICAWDGKFVHDFWRPVTAIREADTDGNPETEPDPNWSSLITTPPFPEYTSGHSTFSRSAATVLAGYFGTDNIPFTATSDLMPGVTRRYLSFSAAADEAGISRLYGGIHWPSANLHGQAGGYRIGERTLSYFLQPLDALQFSSVHRAGDLTQFELRVLPNQTYTIRASSDLKTWETIATLSSPEPIIRFTDANAGDRQVRFYEAIAQ